MAIPEGFDIKQAHVAADWAHDNPLVSCRFDPLGRYVFCGSQDALIERFSLADGAKTLFSGGHETWVQSLAFSKDGAQTISGGCDGKITWWDTTAAEPKPLRTIEAHQGWVRSLDTSPDGTLLVSGGNDNMVRLWNMADGKLVREMAGHPRNVYSVMFHPQGEFLLSGDLMGGLKQWEVATGKEPRTFDAATLHEYNTGQLVDYGGVRTMAISPDGKWLAAGGLHKASNPLGAIHEPFVLLFDWESQKLEKQLVADGITQGLICRVRWLAEGTLMGASGGGTGGFLLFWKPDAEKDYFRFGLPSLMRDMDLAPDGVRVATAHYDHHIRITRLAAKIA